MVPVSNLTFGVLREQVLGPQSKLTNSEVRGVTEKSVLDLALRGR